MKAVILPGGLGTRISEETDFKQYLTNKYSILNNMVELDLDELSELEEE